jgi:parvulin-like peptidyl-prolyl isomerase
MENNQNTMPTENKKNKLGEKGLKNREYFIYGFLGLIGLVVIAAAGFGVVRVYFQGATDSATEVVSSVLRLPLAKVNGHVIMYSSYINDMKAIRLLRDYDKKSGGEMAALTDVQLSDNVVNRLIDNIIVSDLCKKYNLSVTNEDVDNVKKQLLSNFKDQATAEQEILKRYGWTFLEYENNVIRPYIMQGKLYEYVQTSAELRSEKITKAEMVLQKIKDGASFEEMAKQYGEDGTAEKGGDLGWFGKGEMIAQFEQAVFAMKKGELSQELVETTEGFHIIQVVDTKTEQEKDSTGKTVDAQKVQARHIFFRLPNYTVLIEEARQKANTNWYAPKVNNPLAVTVK